MKRRFDDIERMMKRSRAYRCGFHPVRKDRVLPSGPWRGPGLLLSLLADCTQSIAENVHPVDN